MVAGHRGEHLIAWSYVVPALHPHRLPEREAATQGSRIGRGQCVAPAHGCCGGLASARLTARLAGLALAAAPHEREHTEGRRDHQEAQEEAPSQRHASEGQ